MKLETMLTHNQFFYALEQAGVITNAALVNRVVIDAARGRFVIIHVELTASKDLLDVVRALDGVQVTESAPPGPEGPTA